MAGAGLGALGLLAWLSGIGRLTQIIAGQRSMMPTTALSLLLIGAAGALRSPENPGRAAKAASVVAALVVLSVAVATLAEYLLAVDLHIDRALFPVDVGPYPGRPSALTAVALTFLSSGVMLFDRRPHAAVRPSECLVLLGGLAAFSALIAFAFGGGPLLRLMRMPVLGVALPTAIALLLISLGMLLERPRGGLMSVAASRGPGGVLLRRLAIPALMSPALLGIAVTRIATAVGAGEPSFQVALLAGSTSVVGLIPLTLVAAALNRAHRALQESHAQTRDLVELAPDGIFLGDLAGRLIDANGAGCRMLGYTREEILQKKIVDLVPAGEVERLRNANEALVKGGIEVAEWHVRRKDGSYVPVEVSTATLPHGRWQGFVRDITDRKRREWEQRFLAEIGVVLAASLDYEATLARVAQLAVRELADFCIVDSVNGSGNIERLDVACRDPKGSGICDGLRRGPPSGRPSELFAPPFRRMEPMLVEEVSPAMLSAWAQDEEELRTLRAVAPTSVLAVPLVARDKLLGVLKLLSSTPTHKYGPADLRLAQEVARQAALSIDNARLYQTATRAIREREDVLGMVAHDLRNPLASILMNVGLLRRSEREAASGRLGPADRIERAATRMDRLLRDLLDVARLEAGHLSIEPDWLQVGGVVTDILDAHQQEAASASCTLEARLAPDLPDVWADRDRCLEIFDNLVGNALKFSRPGGRITIGASPRDGEVMFFVGDTGPGMSGEELSHLFDRFWQARKADRRGTGLGLSIVKGLVETHGGHVWVESALGRGTTVFFTLPATTRPAEQRAGPVPATT